jgi:hypothetical protein
MPLVGAQLDQFHAHTGKCRAVVIVLMSSPLGVDELALGVQGYRQTKRLARPSDHGRSELAAQRLNGSPAHAMVRSVMHVSSTERASSS